MADTLLGIETILLLLRWLSVLSFTLADTLLGIETSPDPALDIEREVSLWLIPF